VTAFLLVHGGGHSSRCWEPTVPHLAARAVAIDLPGRGRRPGPLDRIRVADWIDAAVDDLLALDEPDVVLVGHSMAGLTIPGVLERAHDRIRHVVFVSCAIVPPGSTILDLLPADLAARARAIPASPAGAALTPEETRRGQCYDMDDDQARFTLEVVVPEACWPTREAVVLTGLERPVPRTWIRLLRDQSFPPAVQDEMARRARCDDVVDLDSGHMAMISHPVELAAALNRIHAAID
jgi:pimeloyl-ACP methyl ester carboxylesterase